MTSHEEARPLGRWLLAAVALTVGAAVAALRVLGLAGFSNDHFFYLTRATQIVFGDRPAADFVDPGFPLVLALSAAAQALGGHTLLAEAVLVGLGFGIGAGATVWIVTRWTGSLWLALWAAFVEVAVLPRTYSYPKILVYVLGAAAFIAYSRKPRSTTVLWLAVVVAVAFLFRHDHGVYLGVASAVLVAAVGEEQGFRAAIRRLALFTVVTTALIAPYLIYVQVREGVAQYLSTALVYAERDARRTVLGWPRLDGVGLWSVDGLAVAGYYACWVTPVVAIAVAWTSRRAAAASALAASALALAALFMNAGLLRDPLAARVPDVVVPFAVLMAWIAARAWSARPPASHARWVLRGATAAVLLIIAAAAATLGGFEETLDRAGLFHRQDLRLGGLRDLSKLLPRPDVRWRDVSAQLRAPFAEQQMPTDLAFALVPFYEYARACTPADSRVLVTGYAPEIAYYAGRGFAGGHPSLYRGYFSSPDEQRETVARMRREQVLFVVDSPDGAAEFPEAFPIVNAYVTKHFVPLADFPIDGGDGRPAHVLVHRAFAEGPAWRSTAWPCMEGPLTRRLSSPSAARRDR